jgi:microcompartment protein CcmL/EutN
MYAIGIIDTIGFVGSVEAVDVCLKTANVEFVNWEKMTGGIVSIVVKGGVGAVNASISAGVEASKTVGGYLRHTVIARLDDQTEQLIDKGRDSEDIDNSAGDISKEEKTLEPAAEEYMAETAVTRLDTEIRVIDEYVQDDIEEELNRKTVSTLRKMAQELNIDNTKIKALRKADLISIILLEMGEKEE